jgi:SAM-dependent methyltransferase
MAEMSWQERVLCGSAPWGWFARTVVLPWALQGEELEGDVLEIGSGSGAIAAALLERFPDVRLTPTDYDPRMVETLRQRLAPFGARARVEQADASALPFANESFGAVVSFLMLHHVRRWEDALREAVRMLRPGGKMLAYDLVGSPLTRGVHRLGGDHGERPIEWPRLAPLIEALPLDDVGARRSGPVFRLKARRSPA